MTSVIALPALMDPMYWLGNGGVFGSAVLVGVMVIIFFETGLLYPFLPGDTLLFTAGMIAAQATTPVDIWVLTPCTAVAAVLGAQCAYMIGRRVGPAVFRQDDSRFFKKRYLTTSHEFFERHGAKISSSRPSSASCAPTRRSWPGIDDAVFGVPHLQRHRQPSMGRRPSRRRIWLGNIPFVKQHLEPIIVVIAIASAVPVIASVAAAFRRGYCADVPDAGMSGTKSSALPLRRQ